MRKWANKRIFLIGFLSALFFTYQNCAPSKLTLPQIQKNLESSTGNPDTDDGPTIGGTNYFSWGVESNYTPNSTYPVQYEGNTTRVCSNVAAHTGACGMKLQVIGNDSNNQPLGADILSGKTLPFNLVGGPALYYRWWMKIMPGFSWGNATAKTKSSRVLTVSGARGYTGYVFKNGFSIAECDKISGGMGGGCTDTEGVKNNDSSVYVTHNMNTMADGLWHEYVVMVKGNSTISTMDAKLKVWIDGQVIGEYNNWYLHDAANTQHLEAWGGWMIRPYFQLGGTSSDGGTIYVDDFSTDDVYNSLIN